MVEKPIAPNNTEVRHAYIDYHRMALDQDGVLRRVTEMPWAIDFVADLVYEDPGRCWGLLRDIAITQPPEDVMISLGVTLGSLLREQPFNNGANRSRRLRLPSAKRPYVVRHGR